MRRAIITLPLLVAMIGMSILPVMTRSAHACSCATLNYSDNTASLISGYRDNGYVFLLGKVGESELGRQDKQMMVQRTFLGVAPRQLALMGGSAQCDNVIASQPYAQLIAAKQQGDNTFEASWCPLIYAPPARMPQEVRDVVTTLEEITTGFDPLPLPTDVPDPRSPTNRIQWTRFSLAMAILGSTTILAVGAGEIYRRTRTTVD